MERLANLLEAEYATLGLPKHIAEDAARRFDLLSDAIERKAGMNPQDIRAKQAMDKEADFDASTIGELKSGPLEQLDSDEPYMSGEFTQQEKSELRKKQEAGNLSDGVADVKVAFTKLVNSLKGSDLSGKQAAAVEKALRLATIVVTAKKADDDEDIDDEEVVGEDEEVVEDDEEDKKGGKKASHGFNLYK
jgi:hypothetical protein